MSDKSIVTLVPKPPRLRIAPRSVASGASPENTSLDEERREILAIVLGSLTGNPSDRDEMAVCSRLLKHLADTAHPPGHHFC